LAQYFVASQLAVVLEGCHDSVVGVGKVVQLTGSYRHFMRWKRLFP
jgi:hypothetical protein